ncbi:MULTISPECIES: ribosome maturation factor RimM [unclassified Helicobacter]|uniref:ribosome maturation factor RimM n=1 Tax=unclassified Helicobacter TaxID=2593540 RepID=UPI000CF09259|nr:MULTISPECIES: ribosome maturation factor RimM [unclassified Helicobacter]
MEQNLIQVATLGRSVGVLGAMKCYLLTDFPEIFQKDLTFFAMPSLFTLSSPKITLTLKSFNLSRSLISFKEIASPEEAKRIVNFLLYSTTEDTKQYCKLQKDEFFWFDIIGCEIYEDEVTLGKVKDIQRIANTNYLIITTDKHLSKKFAKEFLIPYIDHFIITTDLKTKTIFTKNAKSILEAS